MEAKMPGKRKPSKKPALPEIDYRSQVALAPDIQPQEDLPRYLFALASEVAKRWHREDRYVGALLIVGSFASARRCCASGMRQLGKGNPLAGVFISADSPEFAEMLANADSAFGDGAVVIDVTGQVLGAGAYLVVDHPEAEIPEEGGSRHLAASSASIRPDINAVVTISEESLRVRLFVGGRITALFDPAKDA